MDLSAPDIVPIQDHHNSLNAVSVYNTTTTLHSFAIYKDNLYMTKLVTSENVVLNKKLSSNYRIFF